MQINNRFDEQIDLKYISLKSLVEELNTRCDELLVCFIIKDQVGMFNTDENMPDIAKQIAEGV